MNTDGGQIDMIPKIRFSRWAPWCNKQIAKVPEIPGVYLLAEFRKIQTAKVDSRDKQIVYVGETCKSLRARLRHFGRSARTGKHRHSGGRSYHKKNKGLIKDLFIAYFAPRGLKKAQLQPFIKHIERKLIWDYALKYGKAPCFNKE